MIFLDYGGGFLRNSILLNPGSGISLRYTDRPGDSYSLIGTGWLAIENNMLYPGEEPVPRFFAYTDLGEDMSAQNQVMADSLDSWDNLYQDPGISAENGYFILPQTTVFEKMAKYDHSWYEEVTFKGAFGSKNWIEGWTLLYESGYIKD